MKPLLTAFIISLISIASQGATDYKKDCLIAKKYENDPNPAEKVNMSEWIRAQILQIGYLVWQGKDSYAVDVGARPYVFLIQGNTDNCEVTGFMLNSLQRMRLQKNSPEGLVFVFGPSAENYKSNFKTKIFLKEYLLTEDEVKHHSARLFAEWIRFDQNPKRIIDIATVTKSLTKLRKELKRVIDENELESFRSNLKKLQSNSQNWAIEKLYTARGKLLKIEESKNIENMNQKITDFEEHLVLYDQVRRGLWDKAQNTFQKISHASEKLKTAMAKGKNNIEGILKVIRADTQGLEKEIQQCFKESKDIVENELKDAT